MSVKDYRVDGNIMTVTLRRGGEATFDSAIVGRIAPTRCPSRGPASMTAAVAPAQPHRAGSGAARSNASVCRSHRNGGGEARHRSGAGPCRRAGGIELSAAAKSPVGRPWPHAGHADDRSRIWASTRDLYDPQENLEAGVHYLKSLLGGSTAICQALAAYNAGPARCGNSTASHRTGKRRTTSARSSRTSSSSGRAWRDRRPAPAGLTSGLSQALDRQVQTESA